jgi:hypothetical protein
LENLIKHMTNHEYNIINLDMSKSTSDTDEINISPDDNHKKAEADEEEKALKKKRPGRPRKTPIREPRPRNGVVDTPKDPENFVEFMYDKPLIFKKLYQYFKLMAVDKIQMIFRSSAIILWSEDHHKKSKMRIKINANKVNHYYCSEELDIGMTCKNPELIMSTIDKTYTSIVFLSKIGYTQKDMGVMLTDETEIDQLHKIELIGEYDKMINEPMFLDEDYTIKFELTGRYFKKMISDIRTFSDQITIRQDGENRPLIFEYQKADKKIKSYHIVRNKKNIKFTSKLKGDETFRVSFKIDYVKSASSALLSENITIYAHENKPLMFSMMMDNDTVELKILTDIIDKRTPDSTGV